FALSCGLLVIAPNNAHVVSLSAFTVRSGSALPSVHQNFHPISQGTYSASNFIRSRTIRAASVTSLPTPSPGIHAILYLAIRGRLYRWAFRLASGGRGRRHPQRRSRRKRTGRKRARRGLGLEDRERADKIEPLRTQGNI